ncbi:hypothetical protein HOLleu_27515 [Holothuria leucospilota]|uniref:Uncharacterized protein n=1 Tax=Holothuria leucospilota TaxID=206669 RepID=A0A9Q1BQS2_HOLLE|nr:hypothetical protein HOLleu_27515 [Holothuria leucospilota]
MASGKDAFQVDVIQGSILDLQKERGKTEQQLNDAQKKRMSLERKFESVSQKFNQMSEKHCKMLETVKVAQHKVNQSQSQIDSQQVLNQEKQDRITELLRLIEEAKEEEQKDLEEFQDKLSELTDQFRHARHFYTDESLQLETSMLEKRSQEIKTKVTSAKCEVENLQQKLSELEAQSKLQDGIPKKKEEFSPEEKQDILSLFSLEKTNTEQLLQSLMETEEALKDELKRVSTTTTESQLTVEE